MEQLDDLEGDHDFKRNGSGPRSGKQLWRVARKLAMPHTTFQTSQSELMGNMFWRNLTTKSRTLQHGSDPGSSWNLPAKEEDTPPAAWINAECSQGLSEGSKSLSAVSVSIVARPATVQGANPHPPILPPPPWIQDGRPEAREWRLHEGALHIALITSESTSDTFDSCAVAVHALFGKMIPVVIYLYSLWMHL